MKTIDLAPIKEDAKILKAEATQKWYKEKVNPDTIGEKLYAAEHHISIARFLLIAFNSLVYVFFMDKEATLSWLAYTIIFTANSYSLLVVILKPYARFPVILSSAFTSITDGALATLWIMGTGFFDSPFYLVWYVSIIAVAMRYTIRETVVTTLAYIALYMLIIALDNNSLILSYEALTRLGYIPLSGLLGVFFSREVSQQLSAKLTTQKAEAELKIVRDELEERVKERTAELEEKNKDITASISYAKKIQHAILPTVESIRKTFDDAAILYLPKDIISGDFYWFHHDAKENTCYIAAVDCTGHGVPGALMSIMGADLLNQHVLEGKLDQPADILSQLNDSVVTTLKQRAASSMINDGMEMALCKFTCNGEKKTLTFAGANRPVYIVRNGEILCFEGNRLAIGGHWFGNKKEFTQQDIPLEKGDVVYLFSDGFIDQFGGPENKKFMKKRFKDILVELSTLPMESQVNSLHRRLLKWQGKNKQIDDILVMALRV